MENLIQLKDGKMSSKHIADRTGKTHGNVLRDIRSMLQQLDDSNLNHSDYQEVIDQRGYASEILLSEKLCLLLATGYSVPLRMMLIEDWENLKKQPKTNSIAEQLLMTAQIMVQQERLLNEHETRIKELEAKQITRPDVFTIAGYGALNGMNVNLTEAATLGKKATKLCNELGYSISKIPDPRFGVVNVYPKEVLIKVFKEY